MISEEKLEGLMQARNAMVQAFEQMESAWCDDELLDIMNDSLVNDAYPFERSFDEVAYDVYVWMGKLCKYIEAEAMADKLYKTLCDNCFFCNCDYRTIMQLLNRKIEKRYVSCK